MSSNGFLRALARPVGVLSVLSVVAAGLAAMPVAVAAPPVKPPTSAKTVADATRLAAQYKTAVEVEERTSEYVRTVATPRGTLSAEVSNEPVRVRRDSGWVAIDTTLAIRPDGMIAPKAATSDLAFSGGGTGVLARFKQDDKTFDLKSPWSLPAPALQGSKATYSGVLPGVDLVVEVTTVGFSYNLVVLNRQAAANPALKTITFPVSTRNLDLRTRQTGRPSYVDGKGREILTVGEPLMWDSTGSSSKAKANSAAAVDEGATGQAKRALMELTGTAQGLTVKPDQKLLTAADTVFPVVIDPTVNPTVTKTAAKAGWTAAWELYPNTSWWNTTHSLGVGYEGWSQSKIVRSYFQFKVGGFAGKKIISAYFRAYETHSASCSPRQVIVSRTSAIGSATTWNKQPTRQADVASATVAMGYSGCPAGTVEFNVTNSIQYTSTGNGSLATFGLRAGNETDRIAWKQFDSGANLTIEYIAYPLPAYELGAASATDAPASCAPSTNPTIVDGLRPQVSAKGRVGAGDTSARVFVQFQVISPSQTGVVLNSPVVSPGVLVNEAPGVSLAANTLYTYRARTVYNYDGGQLISAWSPSCYLKIDTTPPPKPTITAKYGSTVVTDCWNSPNPDTCPAVVPAGDKATYTISSTSTDVVALSYGFGGKMVKVNGRSVTISVVAPLQTFMILEAKSHDAAAHASGTASHKLKVGPALPPVGAWSLNEGSGTTAADSSASNRPLTVTGAAWDDAGRADGSLTFNGVNSGDNRATVAGQTVDTSGNFSISAWVRPTAATDGGVVTITGANAFGGMLRYSASQARWVFSQNVSDSGTAASASVQSVAPPILNTWTHLVGVYAATTKKLSLFVNGREQGTAFSFTHTPWKATGAVEVGSYRVDALKGVFNGAIDEVKVFPRAISSDEAMGLANPRVGPPGSEEPVPGLAASYPFDAVSAGRTADLVYGADMTVSGFGTDQTTAITEDPLRGTVLTTTGSTGETVSLNRPVIDASGSFTVTAWVKLSDTSKPRVIVRQAGSGKDSWRLEYRPPTGDKTAVWAFSRATSASAVPVEATLETDVFIAEVWTPLVGYYDAANEKIVLMLGDRGGDNNEAVYDTVPITTGTTVIAGPPAAGTSLPFAGSIDDLHLYAGVVPQRQLCTDLGEEEDCL